MSAINISSRDVIRLEIDGEFLVAYPQNSEPVKFSLTGVTSLDCSDNQLTSLPLLPEWLKGLDCSSNRLSSLPFLPKELEVLDCSYNQLASLPLLPKGLVGLYCSHNQLTSLPLLPPKGMKEFSCWDNPLKYIQFLRKRPEYLVVPELLKEQHSITSYQEEYRLQEINRYLFLTFFSELGLQLDFCHSFP